MKTTVGVCKKVGLPDHGSVGATCHVEFELDQTLIQNDLESFHQQVSDAFSACSQAVHDELARQRGPAATETSGADQGMSSFSGDDWAIGVLRLSI